MILVNKKAENNIIIIPGSNGVVGQEDLARLEPLLAEARVLLLQLEIPMDVVVQAARVAHERGVKVILDPAPARALPLELYRTVDFLTPNLGETAALVGFPILSVQDAQRASEVLRDRGTEWIIIKMSEQGVYVAGSERQRMVPAIPVTAVDTVAAGDAFNGALAAALNEGFSVEEAVEWGIAGGAWAVTRPGAQEAMPNRDELQVMLRRAADSAAKNRN
jgi:ribokinase